MKLDQVCVLLFNVSSLSRHFNELMEIKREFT
jgi:hypothetical protein